MMSNQQVKQGFQWGIVATVAMTAVMLVGVASGLAPMPKPIPVAIMARLLGENSPTPILMLLGMTSHLLYGGIWGAILAWQSQPVTVVKGAGLGLFLWIIMGLVILPFLGWGLFGVIITPAVAIATLILHLIYGTTLGVFLDREPSGASDLAG